MKSRYTPMPSDEKVSFARYLEVVELSFTEDLEDNYSFGDFLETTL